MKLRIHGNSIRLRLSRTEVERFTETGSISETVEFGSPFVYSLRAGDLLGAAHSAGGIDVVVPRQEIQNWASTDRVSIEGTLNGLQILVEKDFKCIHKDGANEDAYPNPLASTAQS